jgi:hypothetical protein
LLPNLHPEDYFFELFHHLSKCDPADRSEIARNFVESQRPSTVTGYAAATPLASDLLETALVKEAMSSGISR